MRVNGEWTLCEDGGIRPVVQGLVSLPDGQEIEVSFLLDSGADRTVFSSDFFTLLQPLEVTEADTTRLAGIGGQVNSIAVRTAVSFYKDEGTLITVRGTFGVFTEDSLVDLSVLGRDVTNNFGVIYDYPKQIVTLLAPPHSYEIKS